MMDTPKPVMLGDITVSATFKLPPGAGTARTRLAVAGTFGLARVQFTDKDVVAKLADLSRRGQGRNQDMVISRVATSFKGQFSLADGVASLPHVAFSVPGATIALSGQYVIGTEAVNFVGTAQLKASLSDAVGGFRSILIKPFNRFFSKDGSGAIIPIEITGTRSQPKFGVRLKQVFKKEG